MIKFKTYRFMDDQVFHHEAFSMLIPEGWAASGGLLWRQHATMPGAINLSVRSPDGLYELNMLPSMPYFWSSSPITLFTVREGSFYMGNEVKRVPRDYIHYIIENVLPKGGFNTRITGARPSPELTQALHAENPPGFGCSVMADAGIARLEYESRGYLFEGDMSCGIIVTQMPYGQASWIADKIVSTRMPKGKRSEMEKIFAIILKTFRINLLWYQYYYQLVQSQTQYVMQDIYNAGLISRIISNTYNQISDTVRSSYERQQAAYDRVFKGISESIRGVNSYYDPYKGYPVEVPSDYRYVYANPLGDYIFTNDASYQPGAGSNLNWTILNRS